jgi:hypothetical protein
LRKSRLRPQKSKETQPVRREAETANPRLCILRMSHETVRKRSPWCGGALRIRRYSAQPRGKALHLLKGPSRTSARDSSRERPGKERCASGEKAQPLPGSSRQAQRLCAQRLPELIRFAPGQRSLRPCGRDVYSGRFFNREKRGDEGKEDSPPGFVSPLNGAEFGRRDLTRASDLHQGRDPHARSTA